MLIKKIIVTGATGGIGQAVAHYLAQEGYNLFLLSRNEEALNKLRNSLNEKYPQVEIELDTINFSKESKSKKIAADGIVIITPRPAAKSKLFPSTEEWSELFQSCFLGPLALLSDTIPHLKKPGKVVILSGISSVQVMPDCNTFGVLRSMWLAQAKSLSYELGPMGICVNCVSPGGTLTQRGISQIEEKAKNNHRTFEEQYEISIGNVPLRKYSAPAEIASVVEFFLSDKSNHVTGTNLLCDGGFTRAY